ncbi:MAG: isoleucine--tRNA ligase, partial [Geminicoccaceae bacterium]|nr:isoleucine--tRNA ligase [Geminicoccaceae bacterium]
MSRNDRPDPDDRGPEPKGHDYRDTVFLPKTDFAMKANLPEREPAMAARWEEMGLYGRLREAARGCEKFVLHDGPPYANGHIHMGTALNKILKDLVVRTRQMQGCDAPYVPGWDCHGLPIEWQIEQDYRKKGRDKDEVPIADFRRECRQFAEKWLDVQRREFKRLGVCGDWDDPYTTMSFRAEAGIFRELARFLMDGQLYRGKKSVMWSPVEKTALAEAEVEYQDHTSTTIWVAFPLTLTPRPELEGASVVIWTTTPWTIPANRAVAFGAALIYALVEAGGRRLVMARERVDAVMQALGVENHRIVSTFEGSALAGSVAAHPLAGHAEAYDHEVPLLEGWFVSEEDGTGLVHIAPSHGADDFELGARHGLEVPDTVAEDGTYTDAAPGFAGIHVYKAADPVCAALEAKGALLARGTLVHSYPMSWRSKAPLIFRATAQWFIPMDGEGRLREKALAAIDATRFVPARGQARLRAMIAERPDWCVSRQRAWGVPIAVFVHKESGRVLRDAGVVERIARAFEEEGADAWWTRDPQSFLGDEHRLEEYEKVDDILDVWFDSGSTHATVLEQRPELKWPASLYLEGSDQHRGW